MKNDIRVLYEVIHSMTICTWYILYKLWSDVRYQAKHVIMACIHYFVILF